MKQSTSVYIVIFLIIAVIAFLLSNVVASVLVIDNSNSTKLTAIENDGFEPNQIHDVEVIVTKVENTTNNTSTIQNWTDEIIDIADDVWN